MESELNPVEGEPSLKGTGRNEYHSEGAAIQRISGVGERMPMAAYQKVALLHSHPRIALTHEYHIADLVELCGLAAFIRDRVGDVWIPVTPNDRTPLATFKRFLRDRRPDLVGISSFTCSAKSALEYAEIAKRHDAHVVLGGYHPSALPQEVLGSEFVDTVVRGEGELTFRDLVSGVPLEDIAGLSYRNGSGFVHNPDRPLIDDLDALPLPLRGIRPPRFGLAGADYHADTIYASRGCRAKCTFCANHLVGKSWRMRSNESVLAELLTILPPSKGDWKIVKFWDPNFMTDADRVEKLSDLILEHGLERYFRFIAETRIEDVIRAEPILPKMRRAGFVRIGCGIESPNRETHKLLKKGINLSFVDRAAQLLTSADMLFSKFLIIGHPNEAVSDVLRYPEYSISHGVELQNTTFMIMTPYPGTEIARQYTDLGIVKVLDWDLYNNLGAVIEPDGIDTLQLQALHSAVSAAYGMQRRFLLGKRFADVVVRLLESLLVQSMMARVNSSYSQRDIVDSLWWALDSIRGSWERQIDPRRKSRFLDRATAVFHCSGREPISVGVVQTGENERLRIRAVDPSAVAEARRIHMDLARLAGLGDRLDLRRVVHDILALYWNPRAFRLSWLPTFAREMGKLGIVFAGMVGFHLRTSIACRWTSGK